MQADPRARGAFRTEDANDGVDFSVLDRADEGMGPFLLVRASAIMNAWVHMQCALWSPEVPTQAQLLLFQDNGKPIFSVLIDCSSRKSKAARMIDDWTHCLQVLVFVACRLAETTLDLAKELCEPFFLQDLDDNPRQSCIEFTA